MTSGEIDSANKSGDSNRQDQAVDDTPRHRRSRRNYTRSQHHVVPRDQRRKLNGVRHCRRVENLNALLKAAEIDPDESGEVDLDDLVQHGTSPFDKLFTDHNNMSAWYSFLECSEEEQQDFLLAQQ